MPIVLKSGNPNLLEPVGPVQACNGGVLPFFTPHSCQILKQSEFYRQLFEKYCNIFMTILPVGAGLLQADGETDRHEEANL